MFIAILDRLRDAVRWKHTEIWRTNCWFVRDNAPAHRSVLVTDFLAKNSVTALEHPILLAQVDFDLFPRPKSALKGRHFRDAADIIKKATEELKRVSQKNVSNTFTVADSSTVAQWCHCLRKCSLTVVHF